eukprot:5721185-Prymnesium_polylepis.2
MANSLTAKPCSPSRPQRSERCTARPKAGRASPTCTTAPSSRCIGRAASLSTTVGSACTLARLQSRRRARCSVRAGLASSRSEVPGASAISYICLLYTSDAADDM